MKRILMLVAVALFTFTAAVQAQDSYAEKSPRFWKALDAQLKTSIESPVSEVRTQSLKNVVYFATLHRDKIDFSDNIDEIVTLHRSDRSEENKTLALVALHSIGTPDAMDYLNSMLTPEKTVEVREMMVAVLSQYYRSGTGIAAAS